MVSKHFLTFVIAATGFLLGSQAGLPSVMAQSSGGFGGSGGFSSGLGGFGQGSSFGGGGLSQGSSYGGSAYGRGNVAPSSGFYGGRLFYGDYITGGGYPGYFAPNVYPSRSFTYTDPGAYAAPRIAPNSFRSWSNSFYFAPGLIAPAAKSAGIRVTLPDPQATVLFDGRVTTTTGSERFYQTPALPAGESYSYTLTAKWTQDGRSFTQERTVEVIPGRTSEVVFERKSGDSSSADSSTK